MRPFFIFTMLISASIVLPVGEDNSNRLAEPKHDGYDELKAAIAKIPDQIDRTKGLAASLIQDINEAKRVTTKQILLSSLERWTLKAASNPL